MGASLLKLSQIASFLRPEHSLRTHAMLFSLGCPRHSPQLWKGKLVPRMGRNSEVRHRQATTPPQCSHDSPHTGPTRLLGGTGHVSRWLTVDWELTPPRHMHRTCSPFSHASPFAGKLGEGVQGGLTTPHLGAPDKSEEDQRNPGPEPPWGGELTAMATVVAL